MQLQVKCHKRVLDVLRLREVDGRHSGSYHCLLFDTNRIKSVRFAMKTNSAMSGGPKNRNVRLIESGYFEIWD